MALTCALVLPLPTAHADPPAPAPQPVLAPLAPGQVTRIGPAAGTGTPTGDYGIGATDLCEFMEFPSGLLQICGDSFAGQGVAFGPHFSPIALHVDMDSVDEPTGVRYYGVTGSGRAATRRAQPAGRLATARGHRGDQPRELPVGDHHQGSGPVDLPTGEGLIDTGELADGAEVAAAGELCGRQAVADQRLLRPDPHAGLAERLGLHRRQRLRPQRTGRVVPGHARSASPTGRAGRPSSATADGGRPQSRCGETRSAR